MNNTTAFAKIARIATGSIGLGAAIVLIFMGAPADAVTHLTGSGI